MEKKAFHRTVAVVLVLALLAVAAMLLIPRDDLGNSSGTAMAYEALFDPDTVMTVDIQVEESAWETMLENATAETYIQCDIVVNGTTYYGVGIRPKGNTSLWLIRCNKKAKKGKTQSRRNRRCGQEILWKRKISAIMGAEHLTMERGTGSL